MHTYIDDSVQSQKKKKKSEGVSFFVSVLSRGCFWRRADDGHRDYDVCGGGEGGGGYKASPFRNSHYRTYNDLIGQK